jgi:multicomponent Na+:H+ antiporter subunit E
MWRRVLPLWCWSFLVWTLLSWTATVEQVTVGLVVSLAAAWACAPLGSVAGPWALLRPRRIVPLLALIGVVSAKVVQANLHLTRVIWSRRPPPGGMVIVPTTARTDAELAAVGVLTSLIVNSQLADLDRHRHQLQYHTVEVTSLDPAANRALINESVEDHVEAVTRR